MDFYRLARQPQSTQAMEKPDACAFRELRRIRIAPENFDTSDCYSCKTWQNEGSHSSRFSTCFSRVNEIADHAEDRPFPSALALLLGYVGGRPIYVVAACDEQNRHAFIITASEPSLEIIESDYRTKRPAGFKRQFASTRLTL